MLIDWFTVSAQVCNFLILVWLMRRFLYRPILHAIDAREQHVASALAQADSAQAAAERERATLKEKHEQFDQQRAALLAAAVDEANAERQRLMAQVHAAVTTLRAQQQETLRSEEHAVHQALSRCIEQEVAAVARKTLADLAATTLEERMVAVFVRNVRAMDDAAKAAIAAALTQQPEAVLVRSAFDMPAPQRALIQTALNETVAADIRLRFETAPDLISGLELVTHGQKVAWSVADYLASLEQRVHEVLHTQHTPLAVSAGQPDAGSS